MRDGVCVSLRKCAQLGEKEMIQLRKRDGEETNLHFSRREREKNKRLAGHSATVRHFVRTVRYIIHRSRVDITLSGLDGRFFYLFPLVTPFHDRDGISLNNFP